MTPLLYTANPRLGKLFTGAAGETPTMNANRLYWDRGRLARSERAARTERDIRPEKLRALRRGAGETPAVPVFELIQTRRNARGPVTTFAILKFSTKLQTNF